MNKKFVMKVYFMSRNRYLYRRIEVNSPIRFIEQKDEADKYSKLEMDILFVGRQTHIYKILKV